MKQMHGFIRIREGRSRKRMRRWRRAMKRAMTSEWGTKDKKLVHGTPLWVKEDVTGTCAYRKGT